MIGEQAERSAPDLPAVPAVVLDGDGGAVTGIDGVCDIETALRTPLCHGLLLDVIEATVAGRPPCCCRA